MLSFFRVHWLGRLVTVVKEGPCPSRPCLCAALSVSAVRCRAGAGNWVSWKIREGFWRWRWFVLFVCLFAVGLVFSYGNSWSKSLCGLVNFCGRTKAGTGVHRWGWKAEEGGNILVLALIYISFKWPWNHIRLYTGEKKIQGVSTAGMLQHMVWSPNEVSPPIRVLSATTGSAAACVTMEDQDLLYPTSASTFFMLSIYTHYLAHA